MPVLLENDPQRGQRLLADLPVGSQAVASLGGVEEWLVAHPDEYVVVLGPNVAMHEATAFSQRAAHTHPTVAVTLVRQYPGPEVYADAMRAGIRGVFAEDDTIGLTETVGRLRESWKALRPVVNHVPQAGNGGNVGRDGKVITVFSPKGGVGKTTVAVNLAFALHDSGASQVCIFDLDLAFGDVAITLQLVPSHTVAEAVGSEEHLDFSLLERLLTKHDEGVYVLAAPTSPEERDRIPPTVVRSILSTLRGNFDYVVVDTAPGFEEHVLQAFDETDECVLVATLDVPTIKNVKVAVETLDILDLAKERRHLVLNRADEEVGLAPSNVESILGMQVAAAMASSLAVATATNKGRPIVLEKPDHPVSKSLLALSRRLAHAAAGTSAQGEEPTEGRRGLFGRRKKAAESRAGDKS